MTVQTVIKSIDLILQIAEKVVVYLPVPVETHSRHVHVGLR